MSQLNAHKVQIFAVEQEECQNRVISAREEPSHREISLTQAVAKQTISAHPASIPSQREVAVSQCLGRTVLLDGDLN